MKRILIPVAAAIFFSLTACNNNEPDHDASIETPLKSKDSLAANPIPNAVAPTDSTAVQPVQTVNAQPATATQTVAAGMNPAHGQPGHRCDIAVGAPLNSAPAKPATTTTTTQTVTPAPATTTKTAPGMNPPHGQPGHRCDIAVGAPLNSAPAKPAATPTVTPTATPVQNKVVDAEPVKALAPAPASPDKKGN